MTLVLRVLGKHWKPEENQRIIEDTIRNIFRESNCPEGSLTVEVSINKYTKQQGCKLPKHLAVLVDGPATTWFQKGSIATAAYLRLAFEGYITLDPYERVSL
jgi:hypothetical protein